MHREFKILERVYTVLHMHVFILCRLLVIGLPVTTNDTKWSIYWIIYTLFGFVEYFHYDFYLTLRYYWLGKCIFLIWLMMSGPRGCTNLIYYRIIRRFLRNSSQVSFT